MRGAGPEPSFDQEVSEVDAGVADRVGDKLTPSA
jgi:hypothetical protein